MFQVLESLPIGFIFITIALLILLFTEVGFQFGNNARSRSDKEAPSNIGPMVGGVLGMLAFLLAFTFSMAASHHDKRKQAVLHEANAIGTAYLRADLIEAQYAHRIKTLLKEYVEIRIDATIGTVNIDQAVQRSAQIHKLLWKEVSTAANIQPNPNSALTVAAVNEVIDMHEKRMSAALYNRIPESVWFALFVITALTMVTLGTQVGLTGKRRLVALVPLSLAFSVLISLVIDLNRPQSGSIQVGQQAMTDLIDSMR